MPGIRSVSGGSVGVVRAVRFRRDPATAASSRPAPAIGAQRQTFRHDAELNQPLLPEVPRSPTRPPGRSICIEQYTQPGLGAADALPGTPGCRRTASVSRALVDLAPHPVRIELARVKIRGQSQLLVAIEEVAILIRRGPHVTRSADASCATLCRARTRRQRAIPSHRRNSDRQIAPTTAAPRATIPPSSPMPDDR